MPVVLVGDNADRHQFQRQGQKTQDQSGLHWKKKASSLSAICVICMMLCKKKTKYQQQYSFIDTTGSNWKHTKAILLCLVISVVRIMHPQTMSSRFSPTCTRKKKSKRPADAHRASGVTGPETKLGSTGCSLNIVFSQESSKFCQLSLPSTRLLVVVQKIPSQ